MSDDSKDLDSQPSSSRGRQNTEMKKKRRIVMRIEFDDSNESDAESYNSESSNDSNIGEECDELPSTSINALRRSNRRTVQQTKFGSEKQQKTIPTRKSYRQSRIINMDSTSSDESSNCSEIGRQKTKRSKKHIVLSEDDAPKPPQKILSKNKDTTEKDENGFNSDSSSNELLEKCPICLLTFRKQEIGSPCSCEHVFCANCIEAWSNNVQTCPIDRLEFDRIIVRTSYTDRSIVREIHIDPKKTNKELVIEDEDNENVFNDEELTYCEYCESPDREDIMLLCDHCNSGAHIYCLSPPLDEIPSGPWYCEHCAESDSEQTDPDEWRSLIDDIREMGIPEAHLRVTEVQQPRIMRTRQNERIRAAVLRRTRSQTTAERITPRVRSTTSNARRQQDSSMATTRTTTTTTTTTTRTTRTTRTKTARKRRAAPRRRRRRYRTYVVEYDLNDFDEKFALKTTRKVIRRRRRRRRVTRHNNSETGTRSASKRLAEQLGVKKETMHGSRFNDTASSFSLFGNANDLEYFSDDDDENVGNSMPRELQIGGGGVQTAVRLSNYGSQNLRSRLLAGKASSARPRPFINDTPTQPATVDLLSNLMEIQDRWHNASRNMERVHIDRDGTLKFDENLQRNSISNNNSTETHRLPANHQKDQSSNIPESIVKSTQPSSNTPTSNLIVTEAPMYPRGGGNPNFNTTGGNSGNYNNRFNNPSSFHGGGSTGNRHSTGGLPAYNTNMIGHSNFQFNNPNFNANQNPNQIPNQDPNSNFSPFNMRFNQRNQQSRNNNEINQRNSLPFMNRMDNGIPLQQPQPHPMFPPQPVPMDNLFAGLPPAVIRPPQPSDIGLFGGLPPPVVAPAAPVLSVPPPPAPPPGVQMPWNSSLFQLNANYGGRDEEEDASCPNFSVYSAKSQEVAKSTNLLDSTQNNNAPPPKDDDGNEDLVQLDDDDEEIPLPPEGNQPSNAKLSDNLDLYEPENPTEENDDDNDNDKNDENNGKNNEKGEEKETAHLENNEHNEMHHDDDDDSEGEEDDEENDNNNKVETDINSEKERTKRDKSSEKDEEVNNKFNAEQEQEQEQESNSQINSSTNDNDTNDKLSSITTEEEQNKTSDKEYIENEKSNESIKEKSNKKIPGKSQGLARISIGSKAADESRKGGVLDLYDEEEWEELNIERPKISIVLKTTKLKTVEMSDSTEKEDSEERRGKSPEKSPNRTPEKSPNRTPEKSPNRTPEKSPNRTAEKSPNRTPEKLPERTPEKSPEKLHEEVAEIGPKNQDIEPIQQDRSYTPCLDENNDPEDEKSLSSPEHESNLAQDEDRESESVPSRRTPLATSKSPVSRRNSIDSVEPGKELDMPDTELISEDEESSRDRDKQRNGKRSKRNRENCETFKKVSNKQRERNYRSEKQLRGRNRLRSGSRRRSTSVRSRSRSRSRLRSRSRSRSFSRSRSRSRLRSRSRSRSRPIRSRSHSPRRRIRGNRRSFSRSRSRSRSFNNKENMGWRQGLQRTNGRRPPFRPQFQTRFKRREMPRYDVHYVVGNMRQQQYNKDRYGRDTGRGSRFSRSQSRGRGRPRSFSRSRTRSRTRSISPNRRNRRTSFSMSPTPPQMKNIRRSVSSQPRHMKSPPKRRRSASSVRHLTPPQHIRQRSRSPPLQARTPPRQSPMHDMHNRKLSRHIRGSSPAHMRRKTTSKSPRSPRFTPRLSRSRSRSLQFQEKVTKKKKARDRKKKKSKKRPLSTSPEPIRHTSRQRDPFLDNVEEQPPAKKKRRRTPKAKSPVAEPAWSPSPSPPPPAIHDFDIDRPPAMNMNMSWTPPIASPPRMGHRMPMDIYEPRRSRSRSAKKNKRKRSKKKKRTEKRTKESRKDKRRLLRTTTPEIAPSKEVFASGNNILVSVSFNKDVANQHQPQSTVVTVPPNREDLLNRRPSRERFVRSSSLARRRKERAQKRKKLDTKPVAIIDLERSPFQVHQEPADIIVLTDSEDAHGGDHHELHRERERDRERDRDRDREHHHHLNESSGIEDDDDHHGVNLNNSGHSVSSPNDKTPPMERLDTIMEESYELPQTGPKTPPEPPSIKFTMPAKKQNKVRNPLHDEADMNSDIESQDHPDAEQYRAEIEAMHTQTNQKIGPNTPPESGPCSPDVYDPCEPTKSPSISPRSPTPRQALDVSQTSTIGESVDIDVAVSRQKHTNEVTPPPPRMSVERTLQQIPATGGATQTPTLNPVELVMKLINSKSNTSQDLSTKPNESPFPVASHVHNTNIVPGLGGNIHDDNINMQRNEKPAEEHSKTITVLSNVLITSAASQQSQHIPVISSPSPLVKTTSIMKLPMPKITGSVGSSSSGIGLPSLNLNIRNGTAPAVPTAIGGSSGNIDDSFNLDFDSPYSPGSADYEDLFDPPPETNNAKRHSKRNGKGEVFDNLFGSSSPIGGYLRLPSYTPSSRKSKAVASDNQKKKGKGFYDEIPNSAVDLQNKDKFLRKLNRQERVVEEVKLILKPRFNKKQITKEDYKEIMRRAVPKICHSRSGEINPHKIKNLIDAYVKKFRAKHKKLNLINTGQVSSAVKCAAYLKKL